MQKYFLRRLTTEQRLMTAHPQVFIYIYITNIQFHSCFIVLIYLCNNYNLYANKRRV